MDSLKVDIKVINKEKLKNVILILKLLVNIISNMIAEYIDSDKTIYLNKLYEKN